MSVKLKHGTTLIIYQGSGLNQWQIQQYMYGRIGVSKNTQCIIQLKSLLYCTLYYMDGARGGAVGWGPAPQAGRLRVRFPMVSLKYFLDMILPAALWTWGRLCLYEKSVPEIFPGNKCGWCRLSWNLETSTAWKPQVQYRVVLPLPFYCSNLKLTYKMVATLIGLGLHICINPALFKDPVRTAL